MSDHPMRIAPLPPEERDERTAELLSGLRVPGAEGRDLNIFATLARHPKLLKRWSAFGGVLLYAGALPARERELLILRTAWNCGSDYEWGQHVPIGIDAALTPDEVAAIAASGPDDAGWSDGDRTLLRAADELHDGARISDETWAALAERWDEAQLIEVCMVVGQYHLVGFTLNSLGVQREEGVEGFPS